jgi:DNA-directed RNA polymerase specialized sigma subunit
MEESSQVLSVEEANALVAEHMGWAESIARSVARAWNLDWRLDGLDGGAMEALVYCSRRFDPSRGVPFKGYARRRIHEASTEVARRSRGWKRTKKSLSPQEARSREISGHLLSTYPELREGRFPEGQEGGGESGGIDGIRQVLASAALLAMIPDTNQASQDDVIDYKKTITIILEMDLIHQHILYDVYWEGKSLRQIAGEWNTEPLNIIREHQTLLSFLQKTMTADKKRISIPRIRPGLRDLASTFTMDSKPSPFARFAEDGREIRD